MVPCSVFLYRIKKKGTVLFAEFSVPSLVLIFVAVLFNTKKSIFSLACPGGKESKAAMRELVPLKGN